MTKLKHKVILHIRDEWRDGNGVQGVNVDLVQFYFFLKLCFEWKVNNDEWTQNNDGWIAWPKVDCLFL